MHPDDFDQRPPEALPLRSGSRTPQPRKVAWEGCPLFPQAKYPELMVPEDRPIRVRVGVAFEGGTAWFNTRAAETSLTEDAIHRRWGPGRYRIALHAVNPETGATTRDSYLRQETIEIRPAVTLDDPEGLDDVGREPWPITVSDDALPSEVRDEHERRAQVRDELKLAATPVREEPTARGARRPGARGFLTRGRADRRGDGYRGDARDGYDRNDNYEREPYEGDDGYDQGDYPRAQNAAPQYPLPQGYVWAVMPDGQWAPVPTAPVAKPASETETLTALLFKKMIGDGALSEDDRDERAAKRRREEAEWEDRRAREKAEAEDRRREADDRRAREKAEHDERLAMLALQREKLAAEIRALSTPAAPPPPPPPAVNVEEVALRSANAVRLEYAQMENRRLLADARAAQLAAAQQNRPRNPAEEMKQRVEQVDQIRDLARSLGMVEPTEAAIEASGGDMGFSLMEFLNTEAGKIVADRGMNLVAGLFSGPRPNPQGAVVTQHPTPNAAPFQPPPEGYPYAPQAFAPPAQGYPLPTQGFQPPQGYAAEASYPAANAPDDPNYADPNAPPDPTTRRN